MQLRVVTDQPWDVAADVLVVPIVGEPAFEGPLGELDRRAGGELRALAAFGELKRQALRDGARGGRRDPRAAGSWRSAPATRPKLDRETVVRVGGRRRTPARRPDRRTGSRSGSRRWSTALDGGAAEVVAELVARGVVEGSYDPRTIYREDVESSPPELDELILVAPGADAAAVTAAGGARPDHRRGRQPRPDALQPGRPTTSARRSSPTRPAPIAERHGLWIDVIGPEQATELGMGMFMAVGRGSDNPPRMIVLRSGGAGEHDALDRHLAIVGKGVCFDSGGISIKPADRMDEMKMDKTGACTVHRGHRDGRPAGARARRCSPSRRRSRTCPARTPRGPATSSAR